MNGISGKSGFGRWTLAAFVSTLQDMATPGAAGPHKTNSGVSVDFCFVCFCFDTFFLIVRGQEVGEELGKREKNMQNVWYQEKI